MTDRTVKFADIDTASEGLILTGYNIQLPSVETALISVPGRKGLLDITDATNPQPQNLEAEFTFEFMKPAPTSRLSEVLSQIIGRRMTVQPPDRKTDSDGYIGRVIDCNITRQVGYITISVKMSLEPEIIDVTKTASGNPVVGNEVLIW